MGKNHPGIDLAEIIEKELRNPICDLYAHPAVQTICFGREFGGQNKQKGLRPTIYYNNALRVQCSGKNRSQEIFVVVPETEVDAVKEYIKELNQKYF